MNDLYFTFLEIRISILEDILITNPNFKSVYKDAYLNLKEQTLKIKPDHWEELSFLIEEQLQRIGNID